MTALAGALLCALMTCPQPGRAEDPAYDVAAGLERAAALLLAGRPTEALEVLRPVERHEPDNPWLWFYRGTARLQLGEPYRAMDDYDHALDVLAALGEPDPDLTRRIHVHRRRARQQVLSFTLQTGFAWDTNVTFLGDDIIGTVDRISGRPDGKFSTSFDLHFAPIADAEQTLTLGTRLAHAWHFSVTDFNFQDYGATVAYARRFGRNWEAAVRYDYDMMLLGNDSFLSNHAVTPSLGYFWDPVDAPLRPKQTRVYYQFEWRSFLFDTPRAFDRDGPGHGVGVDQSFAFEPVEGWVWDLAAGYRWMIELTRGTEFERRTHDFLVSVGVPLVRPGSPHEYLILRDLPLIFRFSAQWQIGDYLRRSLIDSRGRRRSDVITVLGWSLSQKLIEDPDLGDLTLHGIIQWMNADSNVAIRDPRRPSSVSRPFSFDKVVYGVQLAWTW